MRMDLGVVRWLSATRYICDALGEGQHVLHRLGVAQLDRPLVVLPCAAPARGHALTHAMHHPEQADGLGIILSRGLLEPWPCLLIVHGDTVASIEVYEADLILAQSVTRLGSDLVRRHRPRVVDRHAFAPVVHVADGLSCEDVALDGRGGAWLGKMVSASSARRHQNSRTRPLT